MRRLGNDKQEGGHFARPSSRKSASHALNAAWIDSSEWKEYS